MVVEINANPDTYLKMTLVHISPLKWLGLHPLVQLGKIQVVFFYSLIIFEQYLAFCLWSSDATINTYADILESTVIHSLAIVLLGCFTLKRNKIKEVIGKIPKFWTSNIRNHPELVQIHYITKYYYPLIVATGSSFILKSIFGQRFVYSVYQPDFYPWWLNYILNLIAYVVFNLIFSRDPFFGTQFLLLSLQFRILATRIRELNFDKWKDCQEEIKKCVEHHNFLFEILDDLNNINRVNILAHAFIIEFVICAELVIVVKLNGDMGQIISAFFAIFTVSIMLVIIYAWPGTCINKQAADVYFACYESGWYNCENNEIKKQLILMMERAQRDANVEAGKFFFMNLETATQVFKSAMSFFSFINAVSF